MRQDLVWWLRLCKQSLNKFATVTNLVRQELVTFTLHVCWKQSNVKSSIL